MQVATDAEFALGVGRPYSSLLGVFWGTGVGGGIVLDGRPWIGRDAAGEIGHVVVKGGGALCGCGRRGCLEAYAGRASMEGRARRRVDRGERTMLFKIMKDRGRTRLTSGVWARALEKDDVMAHDLIERALRALGVGVASAQNLLDVESIVIGGGLGIRLGQPYADRIREAMMPHLFNDGARRPSRSRRSATSAARSARRCWCTAAPRVELAFGGARARAAALRRRPAAAVIRSVCHRAALDLPRQPPVERDEHEPPQQSAAVAVRRDRRRRIAGPGRAPPPAAGSAPSDRAGGA